MKKISSILNKIESKIIISLFLFLASFFINNNNFKITILFFTYILIAYPIILKAIKNIKYKEFFDENTLMTIATVGAIIIGEIAEGVAVMLFYQIGELFQSYAVDKSRKSIVDLMDIRPDFANLVKNNGEIEKVDPDILKIGDIIEIKVGEKVPVDCVIVQGNSTLDTSPLTGESLPVEVFIDDVILSASINLSGLLRAKVKSEFYNSTVSKVLELVEDSTARKSKSERFITKFSKIYTPIVVLLAFLLATLPPLLIDGDYKKWIIRALSFLVVSCPCALVISVPMSFFGGIGFASKSGILIKGGNYLENLSKLSEIVFDKTGTITKGNIELEKIEILDENFKSDEILELAAISEYASNHPLSKAILRKYNKKIDLTFLDKIEEISGKGIKAIIENKKIKIGNDKLIDVPRELLEKNINKSVIYLEIDTKLIAYLIFSDTLKKDIDKTMQQLKNYAIKLHILSGDKENIVKDISIKAGIDNYKANLLPQDKVFELEKILKNKKENTFVAFVGDGINDTPSLALADIGIGMGAIGSDSAIESSDIILMNDEISKIPLAIKIAKKTIRIANENIIFALTVKIIVIILAALGYSTMWEAVFADVGVTILAVINSMRTLQKPN